MSYPIVALVPSRSRGPVVRGPAARAPIPLPLALIALLGGCGPGGADGGPRDVAEGSTPEVIGDALAFEDLRRTIEVAHEKFTSLAAAMPEESYDWRPMEGVRSVGEVYAHVAADNWFVPALIGVAAPAETGVTDDVATFRAYQDRDMSKQEIVAAVDASFEHFLMAMERTGTELDREVVLGTPTTAGDVWIRATTHLHEHLGQAIAYARANGVVAPWSR